MHYNTNCSLHTNRATHNHQVHNHTEAVAASQLSTHELTNTSFTLWFGSYFGRVLYLGEGCLLWATMCPLFVLYISLKVRLTCANPPVWPLGR